MMREWIPERTAILVRLIIVAAAILVAVVGNGAGLPLDEHEVFVARTSEEMLQRGSLIVPYLNGEPRLTKPPMAYWLTMLVDQLGGGDHVVSEWEARVPPMVGGVLFALAACSLAQTLFNTLTGFIAAMLLVSSGGFVSYTHSARPEMLYAMFCTMALACFAKAWVRADEVAPVPRSESRKTASPPVWSWLGWVLMGLAILTKGPQLPLLLMGSWCAGMLAAGERGRIAQVIRPISGLLIAAAVSLWWFTIIWTTVSRGGATMEKETIGRIFDFEGEPLTRYLDPYYVYRTAGLLLPWALPYALALAAPWVRQIRMTRAARLLWWVAVPVIAVMHLTLNRRWYYLLPLTGVLTALMAWAMLAVGTMMIGAGRVRMWRALAALHVVMCALALGLFWKTNTEWLKPGLLNLAGMAAVSVAALVGLFAISARRETVARPALLTIIVALSMIISAAARESLWSPQRFIHRDFCGRIAGMLQPDMPLLGWHDDWQIEQYYLHRDLKSFEAKSALEQALRTAGQAWLLTGSHKPLELPAAFNRTLAAEAVIEPGHTIQLWHVSAPSATSRLPHRLRSPAPAVGNSSQT